MSNYAALAIALVISCSSLFAELPNDPCFESYKDQKVLPMGAIDKPKAVKSCEPIWPERKSIKGVVAIEVILNDKGVVVCARVLHSSIKDAAYSKAALDAVTKCSFTVPRDKEGNAVWVYHIIQYRVPS